MQRHYICIDLKSFYASVECVERGLDPMTAKLVVADPERSSNTICLAVTPTMKRLGVHNRCRIGDIPKSIDYIVAQPRMQKYIDYAARIYGIYLSFISKDDIHVYSIDEAFMDVTDYLDLYKCTPHDLGQRIMDSILEQTGIRATCGVGTNLYLTKIALDITAKHSPDFIGDLTEESYRATLWDHKPLTDFWRIGRGTALRLANYGILTMRDIAHTDEDFLYRLFGIDAELLIDHAWGREPVTIADIHNYNSRSKCLSSGQVLMSDYPYDKGRLIVKEMMDVLCLDMLHKNIVTDSVTLFIGYSGSDYGHTKRPGSSGSSAARSSGSSTSARSSGSSAAHSSGSSVSACSSASGNGAPVLESPRSAAAITGSSSFGSPRSASAITGSSSFGSPRSAAGTAKDMPLPSFARGTTTLGTTTSSAAEWLPAIAALYDRIVDPSLTIRRVNITCNNTVTDEYHQMDLFSDSPENEKARKMQAAMLDIQTRFGKDSVLRGMNLEEGAMTKTRNHQIGGHRSGE